MGMTLRKDLKPGDCFRYNDRNISGLSFVVAEFRPDSLPPHWGFSALKPDFKLADEDVTLLESYTVSPVGVVKKAPVHPYDLKGMALIPLQPVVEPKYFSMGYTYSKDDMKKTPNPFGPRLFGTIGGAVVRGREGLPESTIDGLGLAEIMKRYEAFQREGNIIRESLSHGAVLTKKLDPLTKAQKAYAQMTWSKELKIKVSSSEAISKEKARTQVVCERDEDGE